MEIPLSLVAMLGLILFIDSFTGKPRSIAAVALSAALLSIALLIAINVFGVFGKWEESRSIITTHLTIEGRKEVMFSSPMLVEHTLYGNRLSIAIKNRWNVWKVTPEVPYTTATPTYLPDIIISD